MLLSAGKPQSKVKTLGRGVLIVKDIFDQSEHLRTVIIALPDL
jgi:hypoxanthine-guanine phosphoribosyltransferase